MILVNGYEGYYVIFDGIVGCGKSAQINRLKKKLPEDFPKLDITFTYEPGGNPEADLIRQRVKHERMDPQGEVLLFAQSRAITLPEIVRPALKRGGLVISDRSFTTSLDYQGIGRGVGIDGVWKINKPVVGNTFPDMLIVPMVGLDISLERSRGDNPDKFDKEGSEFIKRCLEGYPLMFEYLKQISPETKIIQIDDPEGKLDIEGMGKEIERYLYPAINNWYKEGRIIREFQN